MGEIAALDNSLLLRTIRGEQCPRPPIWLLRQAGRYMPEYRAIRAKYSMMEVIRSPELSCQITLQPIDAFAPDAAIIFSDILHVLLGMGVALDFVKGEGPKIFTPIRDHRDVEALRTPPAEEHVGYTLDAVRLTSEVLRARGIPLIGFSGAPFTLASYALDDDTSEALPKIKALIRSSPDTWRLLQRKLVKVVGDYLIAQAMGGASVLQIFDSWVGHCSPYEFEHAVAPYLTELLHRVRERTSVPIIYFGTNTAGLLPQITQLPVDVVGIDWRVRLSDAVTHLGVSQVVQGNLDPALLAGSFEELLPALMQMLTDGKAARGHIVNVGHGLTPLSNAETVRALVRYVKNIGASLH